MRVVLYYPYIRTAHSSEKTVIFTNRKTAESENRHSKRMQRRGGNIPPHPKEANRKYPIDEARDCPRGPAKRRKRKKHKVKARFSVHFPRSGSVMLRLKSENLRSKLRRMPMLRALPPLAAGILLADHYVLPLWLLVGGFLVCGILALLADDRSANLATLGAILLFGMTVTELGHTPAPPTGTPGEYEIIVRERLSEREGKTASGASLRARRNSETGEWLPAAGNLVVRCDSSTVLNPGDRAVVRGKIYPFTARHGGYGRLMTRRGYVGTLYLNRSSLLLRDTLHREPFPEAPLPVPARTGRRTARPSGPGTRRTGPLQRYDGRGSTLAFPCTPCGLLAQRDLAPARRFGIARGHRLSTRQPAALVAAAFPARTHPAQYRGHPAHLALCRHDGIPAQRRPGRADVLRPAIRPGLVVGIRRDEHTRRRSLRHAALPSRLPVRHQLPTLVHRRRRHHRLGTPPLPPPANTPQKHRYADRNPRHRIFSVRCDCTSYLPYLRPDLGRRTGTQPRRHPALLRRGREPARSGS